MLNRSKHTGDGHAWNTMPDMKLESLRRRGDSYFWKGGLRKGGFVRTPPPSGNGLAVLPFD